MSISSSKFFSSFSWFIPSWRCFWIVLRVLSISSSIFFSIWLYSLLFNYITTSSSFKMAFFWMAYWISVTVAGSTVLTMIELMVAFNEIDFIFCIDETNWSSVWFIYSLSALTLANIKSILPLICSSSYNAYALRSSKNSIGNTTCLM